MSFEEAMSLVEERFEFPEALVDFHNLRTEALFRETGLLSQLSQIPVVVVAGSCGKASTARYLGECVSELFSLTGVNKAVGLGTKPPLRETLDGNRERYQLLRDGDAHWIAQEAFTDLVKRLPPLPDNLAPYDLRYWLLGSMFVQEKVGLGIVEANIGLRLDPASIFPDPVATMITPVGLDHVGLLKPMGAPESLLALGQRAGPTWHKLCAVPAGRRLVCGYQDDDVRAVAEQHKGFLMLAGRDYRCEVLTQDLNETTGRCHIGGHSLEFRLKTLGRHQAENACQAAACLWMLWTEGVLKGSEEQILQAIVTGLGRTQISGRMERIGNDPPVLLNAATGVIKIRGMMETIEETLQADQTVWVCMTVEARLVPGGEIPDWLDTSLHRILESPRVVGFTATAFPEDLDPEVLARWARERQPDKTVGYSTRPERALEDSKQKANLVVLVGQSQAELHPVS